MTFVVPIIAYEDGNAAMDWLIDAIVMPAEPTPDRWMFEEKAGDQ